MAKHTYNTAQIVAFNHFLSGNNIPLLDEDFDHMYGKEELDMSADFVGDEDSDVPKITRFYNA